jgi:uncharacterized protein YjiS (DUF1127 family)
MSAPITRRDFAAAETANVSYSAAPAARTSSASSFLRRAADAVAYVVSFPRRRIEMAELASLTDRELADIGLTRSELRQVFRPGFRPGARSL